jgi:hypothetical protein
MTTLLTSLIVISPFVVAAGVSWAACRCGSLRMHIDQFRVSAPMRGRLFDDDSDGPRLAHELDAIRTRFEQHPASVSGATGERR